MTPQEAIEALNALSHKDDAEITHIIADYILCEVLREVALGEIATAFEDARNRVGFWYS